MQKAMFFNYIFIFDEHELQSFQNLLHNHKYIISQVGLKTSRVTSSYIKHILTREFGGKIGFNVRPQRNQWPSLWRVEWYICWSNSLVHWEINDGVWPLLCTLFRLNWAISSIGSPVWTNDVQCIWVAQRSLTLSKLSHGHWRSSSQIKERNTSHSSRCGDAS